MRPHELQSDQHEAAMRELARFVAELRGLAHRLEMLGSHLPDAKAAPFLHRQLERGLLHLRDSVVAQFPAVGAKLGEEREERGIGLMHRVRQTLKLRRGLPRGEVAKDIESSLEEGLQGNTWTIPIPDLLGFLATGRKSGILWVHDAAETFLLQLDRGRLIHATSDGNPESMRMGEVLVRLGKVQRADLDEFLGTLSDDAGYLGAELLMSGAIDPADLQEALAFQIQDMFRRLLACSGGVFRFQEGVKMMSRTDVSLNVQSVLLDVLREQDEGNRALSVFEDELSEGPAGVEPVRADDGEDHEEDGDERDAETATAPEPATALGPEAEDAGSEQSEEAEPAPAAEGAREEAEADPADARDEHEPQGADGTSESGDEAPDGEPQDAPRDADPFDAEDAEDEEDEERRSEVA